MSKETLRRCAVAAIRASNRIAVAPPRDESHEDYECDCGRTVSWDGVTPIACPNCGQVFEPEGRTDD